MPGESADRRHQVCIKKNKNMHDSLARYCTMSVVKIYAIVNSKTRDTLILVVLTRKRNGLYRDELEDHGPKSSETLRWNSA